MSALVCGKRPQFDDISSPGASPPAAAQKRARYRSGGSPSRYLPGAGGPLQAEGSWASVESVQEKLSVLRSLFPSMNAEELQRALEECGHDLDLTIKGLNLLCLAPPDRGRDGEAHTGSQSHGSPEERAAAPSSTAVQSASAPLAAELSVTQRSTGAASGVLHEQGGPGDVGGAAHSDPHAQQAQQTALSSVLSVEWVDAVVQEMMSARDLDDARQRAARVLQSFGAAVLDRAGSGKEHEVQQLKAQLTGLQRDNQILKRAVAIQHERHLAHEAREAEVASLKQMLSQYQEQLRKLEVNNYALNLHLQKAQVDNSMPNRFHPDVF